MIRKSPSVFALSLAAAGLVVLPGTAHATSTDVVISEVYGGGGNSGAPYRSDFIELRNNSVASVSVAGWSVQYASSTGSTWNNKTALTGSIPAGGTYLVQLATGSTGAALPTPQVTGTTNMSATAGKVAHVTHNTNLTCGKNCDRAAGVKDFVGYGAANDYELHAAPGGSNTLSVTRGGPDTDDNAADFSAVAPTPGASESNEGGTGCTGTRIHDLQRASHTGLSGSVSGIAGIVTAKSTTGFWLQEHDACTDGLVATSEAILVYSGSNPGVNVGQSVTVAGTVTEYRPGGASSDNLSTTEITSPAVTTIASNQPLPAATVVGSGGRVPPAAVIDDDATGNVETSGTFDATTDGIDFWESLEGMRVSISSPEVVGATTAYGETAVVPAGSGTRTPRGGIVYSYSDGNPERIILDDVLSAPLSVDVGAVLTNVSGVVDYSFGNFRLLPTATPGITSNGLLPEHTTATPAGALSVATFNVENLDPSDLQSKFDGLATQIVNNLQAPDLIALEEIQDNSGAVNDGEVSADQTYAELIAAITSAGGPTYQVRQIDPTDGADGGEPGGNIRVAFLFRTDRGLSFVDRGAATATTATSVTGSGATTALSHSPGRIDPGNANWAATRKPLVGEFHWNGQTFFAVANHFSSKGGDDPLFGKVQPPVRSSEAKRHEQAKIVRGFVSQLQASDPDAKVIVLGDINDFEFSQTTANLTGSGETAMTSLVTTLPVAERYTYVYQGNSQVLDQILVTSPLLGGATYDAVHVNAEFATRQSDHDPSVARFTF